MLLSLEPSAAPQEHEGADPIKSLCGEDFEGSRIPGNFARELEVCQKHKLFQRMTDYYH